jgi:hypothetical protein
MWCCVVGGLLKRLGLPYTHLASPQPLLYKQANLKEKNQLLEIDTLILAFITYLSTACDVL